MCSCMSVQDFNIDKDLQKRVLSHYEYVWLRTRGIEPKSLLDGLPISLWGDVTLSLYQENINKVGIQIEYENYVKYKIRLSAILAPKMITTWLTLFSDLSV